MDNAKVGLVIVSDLDGTLLDATTYSFEPAAAVVARVIGAGISLVLCSSKTRAEIEALMAKMGLDQPFISENGGAVYLPRAWGDKTRLAGHAGADRSRIELGRPYGEIVAILREVAAARHVRVRGFADMSIVEIARDCGLSPLQAQLAKLREYDEPFRILDEDASVADRFLRALRRRGVQTTRGGRYFHATGHTSKGKAVDVLRSLFAPKPSTILVGLGDAPNDRPLLLAVDIPVIVRQENAEVTARLAHDVPAASVTERTGPAGWAAAVSRLVDQWEAGRLRPGLAAP